MHECCIVTVLLPLPCCRVVVFALKTALFLSRSPQTHVHQFRTSAQVIRIHFIYTESTRHYLSNLKHFLLRRCENKVCEGGQGNPPRTTQHKPTIFITPLDLFLRASPTASNWALGLTVHHRLFRFNDTCL
jgi:hypothetical protein